MDVRKKVLRYMESADRYLALVLIDIDFFLRFCKKFSKPVCNRIMDNITAYLKVEFSGKGFFHQSGQDEFYVLVSGTDKEEVRKLLDGARKKFRKQRFAAFLEGYKSLRFTFSAGIAFFLPDENKGTVLKKAVTAMFAAKAMRRNHVFVYGEDVGFKRERVLLDPEINIGVYAGKWGETGCVRGKTLCERGCFNEPQAIAVDGDKKLYIADQNNHMIILADGRYLFPLAGTGIWGQAEEGVDAKDGALNKPTGLTVHKSNVYITDTGNDIVMRLNLMDGRFYHFCGTGVPGYEGDGGLAKSAMLNKPGGIVADADGNFYIDDIANNVLRKVDGKGVITTFAGNGRFGFAGDGGPAANAEFNEIYGIAIDRRGRNIYLADYWNHRIRKIDLCSGTVSTLAGNGSPGYSGDNGEAVRAKLCRPAAICTDRYNNIYIAESGNHSVRVILSESGLIFTIAGGCGMGTGGGNTAENFQLANPNSLAATDEYLYILDGANNRICRIKLSEVYKNYGN